MNDQASLHRERFALEIWRDGTCQVKPHVTLTAALIEDMARTARTLIRTRHGVCGIILDVRGRCPLSIVRLSSLIDRLSEPDLPLVVLFSETRHQRVADLLHNTLANNKRVAYTTDPTQARAYIQAAINGSHSQHPGYLRP